MIRLDLIAPVGTLLQRHATATPGKVAYMDDERSITWVALEAETAALARHLLAGGLQPGQSVGVWLANSVDWMVAALAILRAGGVAVPITIEATLPEAEYRISDSGARIVFVDAAARPVVAQMAATGRSLPHWIWCDGGLPMPAPSDIALPAEDIHAPAFIVYTSGTTGKPKGVVLTAHSMLWVNAACWAPIAGLSADDVVLSPLPLFHSYAINISVLGVLATGATERIMPKFSPGRALDLLQKGEVTLLPGVPTMFHYLLLTAREKAITSLGRLRLCISAGAILPAALNRDFEAQFGVELLDGYGITETSTMVTMNWPGRNRVMGSCGLPVPGVAVRIVDPETGQDRPRGEEGELICSGPNVMREYLNKPEDTAKAVRNGWYHTGDLARSDENGFLTITGRLKELVIRGGQNISPAEIEEAILQHPAVRDVAVVGVPHETLGEVPVAYVVWVADSVAFEVLIEHCRSVLAPYKVPADLRSTDIIPRTGSGKTIRFKLRELYVSQS
ncbi:AMP-binding protein [Frigidibacter albus]|uniref:AMP-binding protein n=1 Tax=Frigidibacter albus TaxID=1465486 RepID=A0A6L8VMU6_9RHOB|nr:class I adenylate-forming enzyme family protein [Frigidibacter albus]MZQ91121.1 AMP-binding protein [Frigidibacter albus]NBE33068.1 AMP-binding protein [Frigidibacter albus]GGH62908.1 long-chain-fatty-acid--CoA ligase [Frigidibacter albus]